MQAADDVQFRATQLQRFAGLRHDLVHRQFEAVRIAFLPGKRAELAGEDAVVGIVDVAVDDVARAVAGLALAGQVGDGTDRVLVFGFKQAQGIGFRNAHACGHLVLDVAQLAALHEKIHPAH